MTFTTLYLPFGQLGLASVSISSTIFCPYNSVYVWRNYWCSEVRSVVYGLARGEQKSLRRSKGKLLANLKMSNMGAFHLEDLTAHLNQWSLGIPVHLLYQPHFQLP